MEDKIVIPASLLEFLEKEVKLTDKEFGEMFRLVMKKAQYERAEVRSADDNGEIEHENRLVKLTALTLYNGMACTKTATFFCRHKKS